MHAVAKATGSVTPVSYIWNRNYGPDFDTYGHPAPGDPLPPDKFVVQVVQNNLAVKSVGRASTSLSDRITITSASLAPGTPVQLQLTGTLHSTVTDPSAVLALAYQPQYLSYPYSFTYAEATFSAGNTSLDLLDGNGVVTPHLATPTQSKIVNTFVGATINVSQSLTAQAVGTAGHNYWDSGLTIYDSEALAGNTSYLNLIPLTAGVTLTSEAGIDYANVPAADPVPEPATAAMLGLATLTLLIRRTHLPRRHSSSRTR